MFSTITFVRFVSPHRYSSYSFEFYCTRSFRSWAMGAIKNSPMTEAMPFRKSGCLTLFFLLLCVLYFMGNVILLQKSRLLTGNTRWTAGSSSSSSSSSSSVSLDPDSYVRITGDRTRQNSNLQQLAVPTNKNHPGRLKLPKPIINVGFPKAGTSSIAGFFECNGLRSQHWYCCGTTHANRTKESKLMSTCILENLASNGSRHILEGCGDYDVYSELNGPRIKFQQKVPIQTCLDDGTLVREKYAPRILLPQHHYLDKIHEQFPNATFILNLRPVYKWIASVINWPTTLKLEFGHEFYSQQMQRNVSTFGHAWDMPEPPQTQTELIEFLKFLYAYHNQYVRDFVQRHPSHTLIEVDITKNAGQILADAFGLDASCYGHYNENPGEALRNKREFKKV